MGKRVQYPREVKWEVLKMRSVATNLPSDSEVEYQE
jgi:hypothetical protein